MSILMEKKMSKKVQYKIIDKDGNIVSDEMFDNYDKLADHMLELADKYYQGIYTVDDSVSISTFDETGEVIFEDTASFGSVTDQTEDIEDELRGIAKSNRGTAGQGFGS